MKATVQYSHKTMFFFNGAARISQEDNILAHGL